MNVTAIALAVLVSKFCSGCNFAEEQLPSSDFSNGVYVGANFEEAKLAGSSFRSARIIAGNFQGADLGNVIFDGADCIACNFEDALLGGASFSKVRMVAASFKGFTSAVTDAQLRELLSGCISCNFRLSHLAGRDLSETALVSVDLSGADLRGTNFTGAVLCWYNGSGEKRATICDTLKDALVAGANFHDVLLCDDPLARTGCSPVSARTLRQYTGSPLAGATLPSG